MQSLQFFLPEAPRRVLHQFLNVLPVHQVSASLIKVEDHRNPWHINRRKIPPGVYLQTAEPWYQDEKVPFIQSFLSSSETLLGKRPERIAFSGGLDTRFSGDFGVPSFVFGPNGDNYHGPDEYVEIDSVVTLTKVISKFVLDWCGVQE